MKILLSGDLHLGRTPTRLPEGWRDAARTVRAWDRLVQAALREEADALILSGDLVDQDNRFWEAIGPLRHGMERLAQASIAVYAVAGNHDADVLPRLAAQLPSLHLLGLGGHWERVTLRENGRPVLHLDAWSFPRSRVVSDPTESYVPAPADGVPVLGLVHGDLDAAHSVYAPLRLARLRSFPVQGWLLGHLHVPALHAGAPWVLMPGSPQPLDPAESGAHSAWFIEAKDGTLSAPVPWLSAPLRYDTVNLTLDAAVPPTAALLHDRLHGHLRELAAGDLPPPSHLVLRLRLRGHCADPRALAELLRGLQDWEGREAGIEAIIDRIDDETFPAPDLLRLQGGEGALSRLAQIVGGELPPALLRKVGQELAQVEAQPEFDGQDLPPLAADPEGVRRSAARLLDQLVREAGV